MDLINEKDYLIEMKEIVDPFLFKVSKDGYFDSFDKNKIYYASYLNSNCIGNIIILHGFTESSQKFKELAFYFYKSGYSVFLMDLRGHGNSFKSSNKKEAISESDFNFYSRDLDCFINEIVIPFSNKKDIYIYSHSLGSTTALLYLEQFNSVIKKAILSSPMICGNMGMPVKIAEILSKIICSLGGENLCVPGKCRFKCDLPFTMSDATSLARYKYYLNKRIENDELKTSGPTFGWVKASLDAKDFILNQENVNKIDCDILMIRPQEDKQVLPFYQDSLIKSCNIKNVETIENSKHEIFYSDNNVLEKYLNIIFKFLN